MAQGKMNSRDVRRRKQALLLRDGNLCVWCSREMTVNHDRHNGDRTNTTMTMDHLLPRDMGGSNCLDNLVLACYKCNNKRGNQIVPHYLQKARKPRIEILGRMGY